MELAIQVLKKKLRRNRNQIKYLGDWIKEAKAKTPPNTYGVKCWMPDKKKAQEENKSIRKALKSLDL